MRKKIMILILIAAFTNYIGCYSNLTIHAGSAEEFLSSYRGDIIIFTKDSKSYQFLEGSYKVENDTLYGEGMVTNEFSSIPFMGKISVSEINRVEPIGKDSAIQIITTVCIVLGALGSVIILVLAKIFDDIEL